MYRADTQPRKVATLFRDTCICRRRRLHCSRPSPNAAAAAATKEGRKGLYSLAAQSTETNWLDSTSVRTRVDDDGCGIFLSLSRVNIRWPAGVRRPSMKADRASRVRKIYSGWNGDKRRSRPFADDAISGSRNH